MTDRDPALLEEEAHVANLFINRAKRFLHLMELSNTKGIPAALFEKERELLGVAAVMWVAMHPLEDEPEGAVQQRKGREMVRDGMGHGQKAAEETWTQYVMSEEFLNNPEVKKHIVEHTKPTLTLFQGGQSGNSNSK